MDLKEKQNKTPMICCQQETHLNSKEGIGWKQREWKRYSTQMKTKSEKE
jgi:hypothetical protein